MAPSNSSQPQSAQGALLRLSDLSRHKPHKIDFRPDAQTLDSMGHDLDLLDLRKARLEGTLSPVDRSDWDFQGRFGATVAQACVVTLDPVRTRLEDALTLRYRADLPEPDTESEFEMPEDEALEPLPASIDLRQILLEALALALPLYPRAPDAEIGEAVFTEPGKTPMRDQDARPFAGLADLKRKLEDPDKT